LHRASVSQIDDLANALDAANACDAVAITDGATLPLAAIERVLIAGKHALILDPVGWQWDEMASLERTARQAGARLAIVNSGRYRPEQRLLKQRIAEHLAPVGLLRCHRWEVRGAASHPWFAGLPAGLIEDLDVALWLCGQPVERVFAVESRPRETAENSSRNLQLHLGLQPGMALLEYRDRSPATHSYRSLSVIGFRGAAYAEDDQNMQLVYQGGAPLALPTNRPAVLAWTAAAQAFVDSLDSGRECTTSVDDWRQLVAVAEAVNRSLATRQAVAFEGS
jgi:predicted dehydrogenase